MGLRVHGDSMAPEILDGDVIFIDRDLEPQVGDTIVASVGDEVIVKKLRKRGSRIVLVGRDGLEVAEGTAKTEGVVIELSRRIRRR